MINFGELGRQAEDGKVFLEQINVLQIRSITVFVTIAM